MSRFTLKAVSCLLLVACAACGGGSASEQDQRSSVIHNVFVTSPVPTDGVTDKSYSGVIEEGRTISLGFKTAGQLEQVNVSEGDYVRAGQLLAVLDSKDYELMVRQLQVQYDQLASDYKRKVYLHERNNLSDSEFEQATSSLEQLGVQLQLNKNKLDYTRLYSPVSGYITAVKSEKAEMVDAGTPVFDIMDVASLEVHVDLPVRDYVNRDRFTSYTMNMRGDGDLPLTMLSITPKADNTQLYLMRLAVPDGRRDRFTPGMNVNVRVSSNAGEADGLPEFTVPLRSVFKGPDGSSVWVLRPDSTVTARPISVGDAGAGDIRVTGGLDGTETIIRAGVNSLHEGERVHVIEQESETNVGNIL